jgi:hypothetical protein
VTGSNCCLQSIVSSATTESLRLFERGHPSLNLRVVPQSAILIRQQNRLTVVSRASRSARRVEFHQSQKCLNLMHAPSLPFAFLGKLGDWYPDVLDAKLGKLVLYESKDGWQEALKPTEKNGFTIIDVTPEKVTFTQYVWRPPQTVSEIDTMKPALVYEVPRRK